MTINAHPSNEGLHHQLLTHMAAWLSNTPPTRGARDLVAAMFDASRHGPLIDPEFVIGLVALLDQLGCWPRPASAADVAAAAPPQLRLVRVDL